MSTYRIEIDRSLCSGFGTCVDTSPRHFALDDTGIASVLVTESDDDAVLDASGSCPMGAISVFDPATGEQLT
ncbi:MAG: ferredoxin [Gaiellaceae bacterium]